MEIVNMQVWKVHPIFKFIIRTNVNYSFKRLKSANFQSTKETIVTC